jgi:hypothetical protein
MTFWLASYALNAVIKSTISVTVFKICPFQSTLNHFNIIHICLLNRRALQIDKDYLPLLEVDLYQQKLPL